MIGIRKGKTANQRRHEHVSFEEKPEPVVLGDGKKDCVYRLLYVLGARDFNEFNISNENPCEDIANYCDGSNVGACSKYKSVDDLSDTEFKKLKRIILFYGDISGLRASRDDALAHSVRDDGGDDGVLALSNPLEGTVIMKSSKVLNSHYGSDNHDYDSVRERVSSGEDIKNFSGLRNDLKDRVVIDSRANLTFSD